MNAVVVIAGNLNRASTGNDEIVFAIDGRIDVFFTIVYAAVVAPLLRSLDMKPIYWSTPDRRKANFFKDHLTAEGNYEFVGMYGVENLRARETVCVGDERDDIIECEDLPNYRAYCVKSKIDSSDRAWPTKEELAANHCVLFRSLSEVAAAEQKIQLP